MGKASRKKWGNRLDPLLASKPQAPWWESNLLWVPFGLVVTYLGAVFKEFRPLLLVLAWAIFAFGMWRNIKRRTVTIAVTAFIALALCGLWLLEPKALELSFRPKFSETQVIAWPPLPGKHEDVLKLDNIATLIHLESTLNSIVLLHLHSPPLRVENPKPGQEYNLGERLGFKVPEASESGGMEMKDATSFAGGGTKYEFNLLKTPERIVEVGKRQFRVRLQEVNDKTKDKHRLIVYTFAISEM